MYFEPQALPQIVNVQSFAYIMDVIFEMKPCRGRCLSCSINLLFFFTFYSIAVAAFVFFFLLLIFSGHAVIDKLKIYPFFFVLLGIRPFAIIGGGPVSNWSTFGAIPLGKNLE